MATKKQGFTINNVYIFTGDGFQQGSVEVTSSTITSVSFAPSEPFASQEPIIDGTFKYLIPGLIDAHIHLGDNASQLCHQMASYGVTAALDMACWPASSWKPYSSITPEYAARSAKPSEDTAEIITDVRSAGVPATIPGSRHSHIPGMASFAIDLPTNASNEDISHAAHAWVQARVAEGSQYIKLIAATPVGPSQALLDSLVTAAHAAGRLVVAHAADKQAFEMAVASGADILTHVPINDVLDDATAEELSSGMRGLDNQQKRICVPTLSVCKAVSDQYGPPLRYENCVQSVKKLIKAGVPILLGTDANELPPGTGPGPIRHGESVWAEMKMLGEDVGMTPAEVLNAATGAVKTHFGTILDGRGSIEVGSRADLVLLADNPLKQLGNSKIIERVWIQGSQV